MGGSTEYFPPEQGTRQGHLLTACFFLSYSEKNASRDEMRNNLDIEGIRVDNNDIKLAALCQKDLPFPTNFEKANRSDDLANYLDLTFIIGSNNRLYTKLYDKRDDFDFHIVKFSFLSSNSPFSPSYCVYISHLLRYATCRLYYDDFGYRHKLWLTHSYLRAMK